VIDLSLLIVVDTKSTVMTDTSLVGEAETAPAVKPEFGMSLDDIIKSDKTQRKGRGRGRGRGGRRGKSRGRGNRRGRGRGFNTRGGYQTFYPQQFVENPLQTMYHITQKHGLEPTMAILREEKAPDGRSMFQIQVHMDLSKTEGKPEGSFCLRQLAWGNSKQEAKRNAVAQLLTHPALWKLRSPGKGKKRKASTPNNKNKKQKKAVGENEIPENWFKNRPSAALQKFETIMTNQGRLVDFSTSEVTTEGDDKKKFKVQCTVDGVVEGEAEGNKRQARLLAVKAAYLKLKDTLVETKKEEKPEETKPSAEGEAEEAIDTTQAETTETEA